MSDTPPPDLSQSVNADAGIKCVPCSLDDRISDAVGFCINCVEHLCIECVTNHKRIKLTRNHKLLEDKEIPKDSSKFEEMAMLTFCQTHKEREIEFKCHSHDEFVCSMCIRETHRMCKDLDPISIICENNMLCPDRFDECVALKDFVEKELSFKKLTFEKGHKEICKIDEQTSEILNQLQLFASNFQDKMMKVTETENMLAEISKYETIVKDLDATVKLADTVMKHGSAVQKTVLEKVISSDIKKQQQTLQKREMSAFGVSVRNVIQNKENLIKIKENIAVLKESCDVLNKIQLYSDKIKPDAKLDFEADHSILETHNKTEWRGEKQLQNTCSLINETEVMKDKPNFQPTERDRGQEAVENFTKCEKLDSTQYYEENLQIAFSGSDSFDDNEKNIDNASDRSNKELCRNDVSNDPGAIQQSLFDSNIWKIGSYDISIKEYSSVPCEHTGSLVFKDGNMMIMDSANKVVKLVSRKFQVCKYICLDEEPTDMVLINECVIAVTTSTKITTFSVCTSCNNILELKQYKTKYIPCSVTKSSDNLAILFSDKEDYNPETFIQIRSMNNRILRTVKKFTGVNNEHIQLQNPVLIRARTDEKFIVADHRRIGIYDLDGNMISCYTSGHLKAVEYIADDPEGNIYVCDIVSGVVHQISSESMETSRIIISDIVSPVSILLNPTNRTLILGHLDDDFVHVYQMS